MSLLYSHRDNCRFGVSRCLLTSSSSRAENAIEEGISADSLFAGDLKCFQATRGYRFSVDSVLISHFVSVRENDRILDLGTGCGIIMLILLYRWTKRIQDIVGIELQASLASLARKNLQVNGFADSARIIEGDIKSIGSYVAAGSFDTIVCNPPFYGDGSGRQSVNKEARLARHQVLANLDDFLSAAAYAVRNKGTVYCIYPAAQTGECISMLYRQRFALKRLQFIYSYPMINNNARLVLLECSKNGGGGAQVLAPFYIYSEQNGAFTEEMQSLYEKNVSLYR